MSYLFGKKTFTVVRDAGWQDDITISNQDTGLPVSLVGAAGVLMRIREFVDSPILMELSIANGRLIYVDPGAGVLGIRVTTAQSLEFPENGHYKAVYLYDALIERTAGEFEPAIGGKVIVLPTITRPSGTT